MPSLSISMSSITTQPCSKQAVPRPWSRVLVLAGIGSAVLLGSGCATIQRMNPWAGDDASTENVDNSPSTTAGKATQPAPENEKPEAAPSSGRLDLSVPRTASAVVPDIAVAPPRSNEGVIDDESSLWTVQLQHAIRSNWLRPRGPQIPADFSCDVLVKLTRSGIVEDGRISRSCGHPALDASVISAVQAASPLPLPANMDEFSDTLLLTFTPN